MMNLIERLSRPKGRKADPWKGVAAGAAGGLAGTVAMTLAQTLMQQFMHSNGSNGSKKRDGEGSQQHGSNGNQKQPQEAESPSSKVASTVSEKVFHHEMSDTEKTVSGHAVHFGFGTAVGSAYGVLCEYVPEAAYAEGLPFGAAVMIGADEVAVPALRLSDPPWKQPASTHAYTLVSHLVYGLTTELVRRQVRSML